jgi:hypothetical protein
MKIIEAQQKHIQQKQTKQIYKPHLYSDPFKYIHKTKDMSSILIFTYQQNPIF